MKSADPFPSLLRAFFYEWMIQQRNASVHTVRSYRDTWSLFLRFVAGRRQQTVARLGLADLTASEVNAFLHHTEYQRGDTIGTRNCRLAALRSFFGFVAAREPGALAQCTEILHIPTKKAPIYVPSYLEPEEIKAILAQPDCATSEGQRDHGLLSFLYGKGRKERMCPLWPETVSLLRFLLQRQPRADDQPIFVNRYGDPLSASGVRFRLAEYVQAAAKIVPSLAAKHVTPHSFRHATAVHLVAAGVDITVIRSWLGHVSLDTTNHYAQANLETKRKALERLELRDAPNRIPRWRDRSVLDWLDSL